MRNQNFDCYFKKKQKNPTRNVLVRDTDPGRYIENDRDPETAKLINQTLSFFEIL